MFVQQIHLPIKSKGVYFDLAMIYNDLNGRYFNHTIQAELAWGQRRSKTHKYSLRLGSYHPVKRRITINPCLDQAIVPYICLERIMFHEMLHQHFPSKKSPSGKNLVHYREFNDFEKKYPYLEQADFWLKANLWRLLKF